MSVLLITVRHMTSYTDEQLSKAVEKSSSWRAVLRELGLEPTSTTAARHVRRRAAELGLSSAHFRGARSWSDADLREAVSFSQTWEEAIATLGLSANSGNIRTFLKGHAVRLGIDYSHLTAHPSSRHVGAGYPCPEPDLERLRTAGESIATAWFVSCGCVVSVPVEPAVYDLLVELPGGIKRVQVKTTAFKSKNGWQVGVGRKPHEGNGRRPHTPYEPHDIDLFFILDGDLNMYLIPAPALAGAVRVLLRTYRLYVVGSAHGLMTPECQSS